MQGNKTNLSGLILLILSAFICQTIKLAFDPRSIDSPLVEKVMASEPEVSVEDKIRRAFPEQSDRAAHVAFCESSYNPLLKNAGSSASGLFQIIRGTWIDNGCAGDPFNADDNIACARKIYNRYGWASSASWKASKHCWSK